MRSHDDRRSFGFAHLTALGGALALGLAASGAQARPVVPMPAANGPLSDYPVVVGPTYTAAGTSFTPEDVLNYDQVGYVAADRAGGGAITGSHHTLPLPSYVEVTSLATGRTILVRLERRGPMDATDLIALSPGALAQLGAAPGTPVRVRRVVPPEDQRALLRAGQSAPLRMDTPMSLVEVLKRKLPGQGGAALVQTPTVPPVGPVTVAVPASTITPIAKPAAVPPPMVVARESSPRAHAVPALPPLGPRDAAPIAAAFVPAVGDHAQSRAPVAPPAALIPAAPERAQSRLEVATPAAHTAGKFVVQAGAFSVSDRASKVAHAVGGDVSRAGALFRVRTGPFATRAQAEASLAKVRAAGYSEARIQTSG